MKSTSASPQVRLTRKLPTYCRVVFDNPPLNLMGPEFASSGTAGMQANQVRVLAFGVRELTRFELHVAQGTAPAVRRCALHLLLEQHDRWTVGLATVKERAVKG